MAFGPGKKTLLSCDLTDKQQKFIDAVVSGLSYNKAYIAAGYSSKGYTKKDIDIRAWELSKHPKIQEEIKNRRLVLAKKADFKGEIVLKELINIGMSNITDILSWDNKANITVKASNELSDEVKAAIRKVKQKTRSYYSQDGNLDHIESEIEFELHSKTTALDKLGQYFGLWTSLNSKDGTTPVINQFLTLIQNKYGIVNTKDNNHIDQVQETQNPIETMG